MLSATKLKSVSILEKYQKSIIFYGFWQQSLFRGDRLNLKVISVEFQERESGRTRLQVYIHVERLVNIILSFAFR